MLLLVNLQVEAGLVFWGRGGANKKQLRLKVCSSTRKYLEKYFQSRLKKLPLLDNFNYNFHCFWRSYLLHHHGNSNCNGVDRYFRFESLAGALIYIIFIKVFPLQLFAGILLQKEIYQFLLTHFMLLVYFYTLWKHQKTSDFLIFQGGQTISLQIF